MNIRSVPLIGTLLLGLVFAAVNHEKIGKKIEPLVQFFKKAAKSMDTSDGQHPHADR